MIVNVNQQTQILFLDTLCKIENGQIITDLYRKPTDRIQYLLPSSCHAKNVFKSIPFSLAMRIIRICSKTEYRDRRLNELIQMLVSRNYKLQDLLPIIETVKKIPRHQALKYKKNIKN